MSILSYESATPSRAYEDPAVLNDDRVLRNLLSEEDRYAANLSYFECVQNHLSPEMRCIVADWMMEVCEERTCGQDVFPLSINYLDRFLSICPIKKSQLQLLGSACLLIASKLRDPCPLTIDQLVFYTDNSITFQDLCMWETLVLSKLKWEVSAITAHDFLSHILNRIPVDTSYCKYHMVRRHAQTFIALCARDHKFSTYTPSMISAASVASALDGLRWTTKNNIPLPELLNRLQRILGIETDYLQSCLTQLEEMLNSARSSMPKTLSEANAEQIARIESNKQAEHGKAGTPTDVRDIQF